MPYNTKEKQNEAWKRWYAENKEHHISNSRKNAKKIQERNRTWLRQYKSEHPCKCGEGHPAALDFHHVTGKKEQEVSRMIVNGNAIETILEEISKCVVICRNCHAKLHDEERRLRVGGSKVTGSNPVRSIESETTT